MAQAISQIHKKYQKIAQCCGIAVIAVVLWGSALLPVAKAEDCPWYDTTGVFSDCETTSEQVSFTDFQGGLQAPDASEYDAGLTQATSAREFILNVVNFALAFLGLIAVVVIIYAGFLYVTAHGEDGQTGKAKKAIFGALIGIVLILGSFAIVNTIIRNAANGGQDVGGTSTSGNGDLSQFESTDITTFSVEKIQQELQDITSKIYNQQLTYTALESKLDTLDNDIANFKSYADLSAADATLTAEQVTEALTVNLEAIKTDLDNVISGSSQLSEVYVRAVAFRNELDRLITYEPNPWGIPLARAFTLDTVLTIADYGCTLTSTTSLEDITLDILQTCASDENFGLHYANTVDFAANIETPYQDLINLQTYFSSENSAYSVFDTAITDGDGLKSDPSAENMRNFIMTLGTIYNDVSKMSVTKPKIAVDVSEGNAPLVVNFNGLGSTDANISDVTNQSIPDGNYEWDLDGDGTYSEASETCNEATGAAATCTYEAAGTYRVGLKIVSNDPTNVISGVAYFNVKVSPSTATIVLTATTASGDSITLVDQTAAIPINNTSYKFTLAEGQAGITYDLTGSKGTNGNDIQKVDWDFGDGTKEESQSLTHEPHSYGAEGTYPLQVTVTDSSGSVNHAVVEIYVASPAARIAASALSTNLITPVNFDGATSATDVGSIVSYAWAIANTSSSGTESIADPSAISFDHTFSAPGIYTVTLTVGDSTGKEDTATDTVLVTSQPPIPCFTTNAPLTTQPGTYVLDASCSADPDPGDTLSYEWALSGTEGTDWEFVDGTNQSEKPSVQFLKVGSYVITLTTRDQYTDTALQQTATISKTLTVDSVLDVAVSADVVGAVLTDGKKDVTFTLESAVATGFDIDFNDGETTSVAAGSTGTTTTTHTYTEAGHFVVRVVAYTDEGDENTTIKNVFIGSGDGPTAAPVILVNSNEVEPDETSGNYIATRADVFTFDASNSLNADGTKRGLSYSWNFGDGGVSTQKTVTHTYQDKGTVTAKLVVTNRDGASDEADISIEITGEPPTFESMIVTPRAAELVTPLGVTVSVIGADDPDGTISQYTWWYYDTANSSEKLGQTTTSGNSTILTVNTNGLEGEEHTYGFGVSVKDNEGNTTSSDTVLAADAIPTLTVTNGSNNPPTVSLNADRTSIYVGDTIALSADANDSDGTIAKYEWDLGTGTFSSTNGSGTAYGATINQTFTTKNTTGLKIRVRVTDDAGATAEDNLTVYVDSDANPPEAAFTWTAAKKVVTFKNNSSADSTNSASLSSYAWDLNTNVDANGNGTRNDDVDSTDANPIYTYSDYGTYTVQLTVTDSNGETDKVSQTVTLTAPAVTLDAKLTSDLDSADNGSTIVITGDSGTVTFSDSTSTGEITKYWIDGNVYYDSDKNGKTDDDHDYESTTAGSWSITYKSSYGQVMAKLTVEDEDGNSDYVTRPVTFDTTSSNTSTDILKPEGDGALLIVAVLLLSGIVLLMQEGIIPLPWGGGKRGRRRNFHKK